jgi:hypothetical protein
MLFLLVWWIIVFQQSPNAFLKIHIQSHFDGMLQVGRSWRGTTGRERCVMGYKDMVNRLQTQQETQQDRSSNKICDAGQHNRISSFLTPLSSCTSDFISPTKIINFCRSALVKQVLQCMLSKTTVGFPHFDPSCTTEDSNRKSVKQHGHKIFIGCLHTILEAAPLDLSEMLRSFRAILMLLLAARVPACEFSTENALNNCLSQSMTSDETVACDDCVIANVVLAQSCNDIVDVIEGCPCGSCRDEYLAFSNCISSTCFGFECDLEGTFSSSRLTTLINVKVAASIVFLLVTALL